MEFKTKAALTEWANDQTIAEIAAYYNGLPGVKPVKKFQSRDVAVNADLGGSYREKPKVEWKAKAGRRRKQPKTSKLRKARNAGGTVRD